MALIESDGQRASLFHRLFSECELTWTFTEVLFEVLELPWLPEDELLVWALMVVVVLPSVVVWLTLPLAGRGMSRPLTVKLLRLKLLSEFVAGEEFKESSADEGSGEVLASVFTGAARLWITGPALVAAALWAW